MTPEEFIEIIKQAGKLRTTMRHCWLPFTQNEEENTDQNDPKEKEPGNRDREQKSQADYVRKEEKRLQEKSAGSALRRESVADHSWRIALMAMLLSGEEEFAGTDMNRVIRMCLIHDLGESFLGDIPAFLKSRVDAGTEYDVYSEWVRHFPEPQRGEWLGLLDEMKALETREAQTYKALDKVEALISHNESDLSTWLPLEYDLQYTYGQENMQFSPYFTELRKLVDQWTSDKIAEEKNT